MLRMTVQYSSSKNYINKTLQVVNYQVWLHCWMILVRGSELPRPDLDTSDTDSLSPTNITDDVITHHHHLGGLQTQELQARPEE